MKKRLFIVTISILMLIEFSSIFLMWKSLSGRKTILDNVSLKELSKTNTIAIMLEQSDGSYIESSDTTWPTNMKYNETLSGCIDANGNKLDNVLTYNSTNKTASVKTNTTSYCYLYFDLDVAPVIKTFYIGGSNNPTYATSTASSIYLLWEDTDIESYCISTTNSYSSCSWINTSGTSINASYTLTSGDGTKTLYAFLKDKAGNISDSAVDTIILDTPKVPLGEYLINNRTTIQYLSNDLVGGLYRYQDVVTEKVETAYYCGPNQVSGADAECYVQGVNSAYVEGDKCLFASHPVYYSSRSSCRTPSKPTTCYPGYAYTSSPCKEVELTTSEVTSYVTTNVNNNFVCFGTDDKNKCIQNTANYMYQIIGVTSNGTIKVIKTLPITGGSNVWNSSTGVTWPNSSIKSVINGADFLERASYVPSGWSDKLVTYTWTYGDIASINNPTTYTNTGTTSAKVGLVSLGDIYYSNINQKEKSWIVRTPTWTMDRASTTNAYTSVDGGTSVTITNHQFVRPVFYLNSDVEYISGTGTSSDPFIIN